MDAAGSTHDDRVREQFRIQAPTWTDTGFAANALDWIVDLLDPRPGEQALDVACGAGHLGRALAVRLSHVSGIDLTPEMLAQGDRLAREAGVPNIAFLLGDAAALPWLDAQFDLVVCRITLHQVADPERVVREMVRVTRPGGRVGVTDLLLDDPAHADLNTDLERRRDPSHNRTLTEQQIRELLADAGADVVSTDTREVPLDVEDWMARTETPDDQREHIRRTLDAEIDGGPPTGLRPSRTDDGQHTFTHVWGTFVARPRGQIVV